MIQKSSRQENHQIVLDYVEACNRGDIEALRRIFAEDALGYSALVWGGLDEVAPIWQLLHDAFAFQLHVEEIIVQGENVVARFLERGTSVGPFRGQATTGRSSEVVAIDWFVVQNRRISRRCGVRDSASHFRQMGLS